MFKPLGILILALAVLTGTAFADELRPHTVWGGKISLLVSDALGPMRADLLSHRYPAPYQPTEVWSNPSGSVVLTIDHTKAHTQNDMSLVRSSMSGVYHQTYPDARWLRDELATINGRVYAVFELDTKATPKAPAEHKIIYATKLSGTLLLAAFSAEAKDAPQWAETGRAMLNSLTLRD